MFRPLETICRLHKINLEEKEYNIYSKRNGVSMLRSQHYIDTPLLLLYIFYSFSSRSILCNMKMASSGRNM